MASGPKGVKSPPGRPKADRTLADEIIQLVDEGRFEMKWVGDRNRGVFAMPWVRVNGKKPTGCELTHEQWREQQYNCKSYLEWYEHYKGRNTDRAKESSMKDRLRNAFKQAGIKIVKRDRLSAICYLGEENLRKLVPGKEKAEYQHNYKPIEMDLAEEIIETLKAGDNTNSPPMQDVTAVSFPDWISSPSGSSEQSLDTNAKGHHDVQEMSCLPPVVLPVTIYVGGTELKREGTELAPGLYGNEGNTLEPQQRESPILRRNPFLNSTVPMPPLTGEEVDKAFEDIMDTPSPTDIDDYYECTRAAVKRHWQEPGDAVEELLKICRRDEEPGAVSADRVDMSNVQSHGWSPDARPTTPPADFVNLAFLGIPTDKTYRRAAAPDEADYSEGPRGRDEPRSVSVGFQVKVTLTIGGGNSLTRYLGGAGNKSKLVVTTHNQMEQMAAATMAGVRSDTELMILSERDLHCHGRDERRSRLVNMLLDLLGHLLIWIDDDTGNIMMRKDGFTSVYYTSGSTSGELQKCLRRQDKELFNQEAYKAFHEDGQDVTRVSRVSVGVPFSTREWPRPHHTVPIAVRVEHVGLCATFSPPGAAGATGAATGVDDIRGGLRTMRIDNPHQQHHRPH